MSNIESANVPPPSPKRRGRIIAFVMTVFITAALCVAITALLMNIFQHKQEAKNPYLRFVDVTEETTDPAEWGKNWPREYDSYLRTVDATRTRYGGSEAMPEQKLDRDPWLKRMFAGYAFSIDYRDRRGHAYMLFDQEQTERVTKRPQPGACLHCHASVIPTYRRVGGGDVMKGFAEICAMPYQQALEEMKKTPDGTPNVEPNAHPVSCVDCHDPKSMELRVTRPGFINGIRALAESDAPTPHLPSIERWRKSGRSQPYDPNRDASRQEMRSFACGQCHVEYYFKGDGKLLTFPWFNGLKVEQIEAYYDKVGFTDWKHGETGAGVLKAQHPEFETWSQGVHARSGVACADCHMPYIREGAMKVSDHHIRSPLLMVNRSCQVCHHFPEEELLARVATIQDRTHGLTQRAGESLTQMLDAIRNAKAAGVTDEQLKGVYDLQRKAQWRLDFSYAENSMGFHAPQESARILAEAIDYARQGQTSAIRLRAPAPPPTSRPADNIEGVIPADKAPPGSDVR
ncbi:MAG: ammonia-forming cytochrome c nitrite reductase subunit c552 [Phycisphaerales bacterium]|jgi:nitrite reductase (cytochrome c-552)|nr:ammonia-forming cytochrome c nitrite reductase subunit c552 [Phycisphaerales bacterium]